MALHLQLFIKANHILYKNDKTISDGSNFTTTWLDFEITALTIDESTKECEISIEAGAERQVFAFRYDVTRGALNKPVYNRSEKLQFEFNRDNFDVNLSTEFYKKYPNTKAGDNVRVYVSTTAVSGATSPEKIFETVIT